MPEFGKSLVGIHMCFWNGYFRELEKMSYRSFLEKCLTPNSSLFRLYDGAQNCDWRKEGMPGAAKIRRCFADKR